MFHLRQVLRRTANGEGQEYLDIWFGGWCERGTKEMLDKLGRIEHSDGSHSNLDTGVTPHDLYRLLKKSIGILNG